MKSLLVLGLLQAAQALEFDFFHENDRHMSLQGSGRGRLMLRSEHKQKRESKYEKVIWCYYDYPNGPTPMVKMNLMTWTHPLHYSGACGCRRGSGSANAKVSHESSTRRMNFDSI